jgi:hypothetical protein
MTMPREVGWTVVVLVENPSRAYGAYTQRTHFSLVCEAHQVMYVRPLRPSHQRSIFTLARMPAVGMAFEKHLLFPFQSPH